MLSAGEVTSVHSYNLEVTSIHSYNLEVTSVHSYNLEVTSVHSYNLEVTSVHSYNLESRVLYLIGTIDVKAAKSKYLWKANLLLLFCLITPTILLSSVHSCIVDILTLILLMWRIG